MNEDKFSERVHRALKVIETKDLSSKSLRTFYDNAMRDQEATDVEREAVIAALEARIRIRSPRDAKKLFGPKDAEARVLLENIHGALTSEFDLSGNTVGSGVKTGGAMMRGDAYVDVYISYKSTDRWHVAMGYLQSSASEDPTLVVRLYCTDKEMTDPETRDVFQIDDVEAATARYREHLSSILSPADRVPT
jgi:hypothetical protein